MKHTLVSHEDSLKQRKRVTRKWPICHNLITNLMSSYFLITVPTSSPHHQGYTIDDSGCLQVTWNPISEHDRNGQIIGYTITYVAACFDGQDSGHEGNLTVHGSSNNVTLCDLRSGLKYRIGISGFTSKGMGPVSHTDVFASK